MPHTKYPFSRDQKKAILYFLDCNGELTRKQLAKLGFFNRSDKKALNALLNSTAELWKLFRIAINDDGPILLDPEDKVRLISYMNISEIGIDDGSIIADSHQLKMLKDVQNLLINNTQPHHPDETHTTTLTTLEIYNSQATEKLGFANKNILIGKCIHKGEELDCIVLPESLAGTRIKDEEIMVAESRTNGKNTSVVISKGIEQSDFMHYLAKTGRLG